MIHKTKKPTEPHKPLTIGICGSAHRSGVTLVTLALSNYLSSGANKWVACLELNGSNAFSIILGFSERLSFRKSGIDFYPNSTLAEYSLLLKEKYDVLILDFGVLNQATYGEFLRCDLSLVLGYISSWNRDAYWKWLVRNLNIDKQNAREVIVLGNLSNKENAKQFRRIYGILPVAVPFLENPFLLSSGDLEFIERVLERNAYTTSMLFSDR